MREKLKYIKLFLFILIFFLFNIPLFAQSNFKPTDISGLTLWLRADSNIVLNGNNVTQWNDCSTNNNNCTQTTISSQPIIINNEINGKPSIRFDGTNDFIKLTNEINANDFSFFLIVKPTNAITITTASQVLFGSEFYTNDILVFGFGSSSPAINNETFSMLRYNSTVSPSVFGAGIIGNITNNYHILNGNLSGTTESIILDGINKPLIVSSQGGLDASTVYSLKKLKQIGSVAFQDYLKAEIAEIIIYDTILTNSERQNVENYLKYKYIPPPVNLGRDINSSFFCDTIILDAESRFSSYFWSTGDTTQTINAETSGIYWVSVTDGFGNVSIDTIKVSYPQIINIPDTSICLGDTLIWNTGLNHNYSFKWQDNSVDSVYKIINAGKYFYTVFDTKGCFINSDTAIVSIDSFATKMTLGNDTTLCSGNIIYLKNSPSPIQNYLWSDGSNDSTLVINNSGVYWLDAISINGCRGIDSINIIIHGVAPKVNFGFDSICIGSNTYFSDSSYTTDGSNIISYNWNFGDGNTSNIQNATNYYSLSGAYIATLVVSTDSLCSNFFTRHVIIHSLPTADFLPSDLCTQNNIIFTNKSIPVDGDISSSIWKFSDGFFSTDTNATHLFDSAGDYIIKLKIKSQYGCSDSVTKNIKIKPSPATDFSYSRTCFGDSIYFIDNTLPLEIYPIITWNWDFGDNVFSNSSNPTHKYDTTGNYVVKLTAKALNGCSKTTIKNISITHFPVADFGNLDGCVNNIHILADSSTCTDNIITNWNWSVDNIFTSNLKEPIITLDDTGNYLVKLIVVTASGCADTVNKILKIHGNPQIEYNCIPDFGAVPLEVNFENEYNANNYLWVFGDGDSSFVKNPIHFYNDSGHFTVKLIAENQYGCKDSLFKTIIAVIPIYDLAVLNVRTNINNNYISVSADIANLGTLPIDNINLIVNFEGGSVIKELRTGTLLSGQVITYSFSSLYEIPENKLPSFVCVNAELNNAVDDIPDNNESCYLFDNSFMVFNPYPDPSVNFINMEYILPNDGTVEIKLFDSNGKLLNTIYSGFTKSGFNRLLFDASYLNSGVYKYQVIYEDKKQTKQFVRN